MNRGKFLKPWQVTDKIIEWGDVFFLIQIFNLLPMTQTQEDNNRRVSKWIQTMNGYEGVHVYE